MSSSTSVNSPKCQTNTCSESSLSFVTHCWDHCSQGSYAASLRDGLSALKQRSASLNLKRAQCQDVDFSHLDIRESQLTQAHFTRCLFVGANLSNSNLIGARIDSCDFIASDMLQVNCTKASVSASSFSHANLRGSILTEAHFKDTSFMDAVLFNTTLWNTDFSGAKHIQKKNFEYSKAALRHSRTALSEKNALVATESYRMLKHYFYRNGLYEDAGWAAYRELTMQRKHFFEKRDPRYIPSLLMDLLSGYTEKPNRVILSSLLIIALFGLVYFMIQACAPVFPGSGGPRTGFWDCLYFSFITFTTVGFGDLTPKPYLLPRLLACVEAFSGPFMSGLYIFTLTRRYSVG